MDNRPLISVIVPVYNAEKYLRNTLHNIISDQFGMMPDATWELIMVNDGSTDKSAEIIREIAGSNPRVRLIDKPNSGAADSRNVGLRAATGDYVYFLDSDDLLLRNTLPAICRITRSSSPDLIKFCLKYITPDEYLDLAAKGVPDADINDNEVLLMSPAEFLNKTEAMTTPPGDCTVLTVYRRGLLTDNSLEFNPEITIGEDVDLTWRAMFCATSVAYIPRELHLYNIHPQSVSRNSANEHRRLLAYADHLANMLHIRDLYRLRPDMISTGADAGLRNSIRYLTNHILSQQIVRGESLPTIYRTMRKLKRAGADIHPGRPRFERAVAETATAGAKVRRWFVAYFLVLPTWLTK